MDIAFAITRGSTDLSSSMAITESFIAGNYFEVAAKMGLASMVDSNIITTAIN